MVDVRLSECWLLGVTSDAVLVLVLLRLVSEADADKEAGSVALLAESVVDSAIVGEMDSEPRQSELVAETRGDSVTPS